MARATAASTDIASGTFGTSTWTIDSAGVLHLGAGTFVDSNGTNPWAAYADSITSISFDGKIVGSSSSAGLFRDLTKLTTVTNANQFDTSKVTNFYAMFDNDSALTSIDVSNWDTSSVVYFQATFYNMSSLASLDVSNFNTSSATDVSWMFMGDSSLTSLDVSSFNTSKVTTFFSTFNGLTGLTSLDVSNLDTS